MNRKTKVSGPGLEWRTMCYVKLKQIDRRTAEHNIYVSAVKNNEINCEVGQ